MAGSEWQKSGIPWRPRGRVRPFLAVHVCAGSVESKPSEPDAKGKGVWDMSSVKEKRDVKPQAERLGLTVFFALLAELFPEGFRISGRWHRASLQG